MSRFSSRHCEYCKRDMLHVWKGGEARCSFCNTPAQKPVRNYVKKPFRGRAAAIYWHESNKREREQSLLEIAPLPARRSRPSLKSGRERKSC